jgi:hypothetical protein
MRWRLCVVATIMDALLNSFQLNSASLAIDMLSLCFDARSLIKS